MSTTSTPPNSQQSSPSPQPTMPAHAPASLTLEGSEILFPSLPYDIQKRATSATQDPQLQAFVNNATLHKDTARKEAFAQWFGDKYDDLRTLGGQIKQHTLDYLDHYLDQWIDNAEAAGVKVHYAATDEEANAICVDIAKRHDAKLCVKTKSMVTEETHLVPDLEAIGCETIETDLGEFILQLDHDAPSHIVTPMIHKDRTAVARAFTRELGAEYTENPEALAMIARNHLREKYRQADIGISGGNFLVAESGSVVICTNEGNGRLSTSVPPVHIAFVGIEKMIPRRDDLAVLLKLLARSAVGQPLTVYTHIMTGPKRATEMDGPEEMHVILIDNGRTEILREETREMLRCIRCGACLNACPVYRKVGGHAYGAVYSGPIGALITPLFKGLKNYKDLPFASSLCGACYEACPVKIDIPKHLIRLRGELIGMGQASMVDKVFFRLWATSLKYSPTYRLGGWAQKMAFRMQAKLNRSIQGKDPYVSRGWLEKAPGPVAGWTSQRSMPTPPARSFRDWWRSERDGKTSDQSSSKTSDQSNGDSTPGKGA